MLTKIVFSLVLVFCYVGVSHGTYKDCGSEVGKLVSVEVSNCLKSSLRCILKRNTNATMELTFTPNVDTDTLTPVVHGIILGVPMPFSLPNPDGCKDSGVTCPLKAGQTYKYIAELPILGSYPMVTVDIKWELQDKDSKDVVCAEIPSKIR